MLLNVCKKINFSFLLILSVFYFSPCYSFNSDFSEKFQAHRPSKKLEISHLSTSEEHTNFLLKSLSQAKTTVMISSYTLAPEWLKSSELESEIIEAAKRGISIYIYFNRVIDSTRTYLGQLAKHCKRVESNDNHAKCVIIDNENVAVGSHDWLDKPFPNSINASWVLSGNLAQDLSKEIWRNVRFYQSLAHENEEGVQSYLSTPNPLALSATELEKGQFVYVMGTPEAHHQFLENEVFGKAQSEIFICSPFIRLERLKEVLSINRLRDFQRRGIRISLATLPDPCNRTPKEKETIFDYLRYLSRTFPIFSYSCVPNLHSKSMSTDNVLLLEGSFNWLSAVDQTFHDSNNNEVSIGIRGDEARSRIRNLRQTTFGQSLQRRHLEEKGFEKRQGGDPKRESKKRLKYEEPKQKVVPASFLKRVETFSGARFGKHGYCVRLNEEYIREDEGETAYFLTSEEAIKVAYDVWQEEQGQSHPQSTAPLYVPQWFKSKIQIFPGFKNEGFCVRLQERDYLKNRSGEILYFSTTKETEQAAYEAWGK